MEKIDVVYILGTGSRCSNTEIRYSLRSLQKNFKGYRRVFIVGEFPAWLNTARITHIPERDISTNKLVNAIYKIRKACQDTRITSKFILMNDDFFFLKPVRDIKAFQKGTLFAMKNSHETKGGYYYRAICSTYEMLKNLDIKRPMDYELHYPIMFDKKEFLKITNMVDWQNTGYIFRSMYGNLAEIPGMYRADSKAFDLDDLKEMKNRDFLSTDNKVATARDFLRFIDRKFKSKCLFERSFGNAYTTKKTVCLLGKTFNPGDIIRGDIPEKLIRENNLIKFPR